MDRPSVLRRLAHSETEREVREASLAAEMRAGIVEQDGRNGSLRVRPVLREDNHLVSETKVASRSRAGPPGASNEAVSRHDSPSAGGLSSLLDRDVTARGRTSRAESTQRLVGL